MEETIRISVRELVAFSFYQPDILPAADASAMLAGTRAHQARQAQTDAQIEKSIRHVYEVDGLRLMVFGRMDACTDGDVPLIEEIKLAHDAPDAPLPEHRAQAMCYAAMLALEKPCGRVRFSVCYVDESGRVLASFEEEHTEAELSAEMDDLLKPYAAFAAREQRHRMRRDETLRAMPFPFDGYRKGQRELAVQVYTAISRRKRLFASLPTGTGKSAAVLFPALKALGEGKADQVLYLTARNTARQSPLNALQRMTNRGMKARCCVLMEGSRMEPDSAAFEESVLGCSAILGAGASLMPGVKVWPHKRIGAGARLDANVVWGNTERAAFEAGCLRVESPDGAARVGSAAGCAMKIRSALVARASGAAAQANALALQAGLMAQGAQVFDGGCACLPQMRHQLLLIGAGAGFYVDEGCVRAMDAQGADLGTNAQRKIEQLAHYLLTI